MQESHEAMLETRLSASTIKSVAIAITVCCCGSLGCLRPGGRKDCCSLCQVCCKVAGRPVPGHKQDTVTSVLTTVQLIRTADTGPVWIPGGRITQSSCGRRMYRGSPRTGSSSGTMMAGGGIAMLRPPKPPCWRDFVTADTARKDHFPYSPAVVVTSDVRTVTDLAGRVGGVDATDSYSVGGGRVGGGRQLSLLNVPCSSTRPSRPAKRTRARIHRTRSEHLIDTEELPAGDLTVNLADTRPHDFRLRERPAAEMDERLYVEENNRRCQNWLAGIEAAEPLDDIGYTLSKGLEEVGLEAVDVEVPEETFFWHEEGEEDADSLKPPINTSVSSSGSGDVLHHVIAAVGYSATEGDTTEDEMEGISTLVIGGVRRTTNGQSGREGLRTTSSSLDVHRKLPAKHIGISEHSGLE